ALFSKLCFRVFEFSEEVDTETERPRQSAMDSLSLSPAGKRSIESGWTVVIPLLVVVVVVVSSRHRWSVGLSCCVDRGETEGTEGIEGTGQSHAGWTYRLDYRTVINPPI